MGILWEMLKGHSCHIWGFHYLSLNWMGGHCCLSVELGAFSRDSIIQMGQGDMFDLEDSPTRGRQLSGSHRCLETLKPAHTAAIKSK